MMKRSGNIAAGFLALAAVVAYCPAAFAQSADLVLCDRVAADPSDPDKPADVPGVTSISKSDVATAIKFCKTASGGSRRAMYQLGRAYAAGGQMAEAVAAYRRAIDKGSTSAMVELGVLHGTGNGVVKDDAQARKLFERAAAGGNPRDRGWRRECQSRAGQIRHVESSGGQFAGGAVSAWPDAGER